LEGRFIGGFFGAGPGPSLFAEPGRVAQPVVDQLHEAGTALVLWRRARHPALAIAREHREARVGMRQLEWPRRHDPIVPAQQRRVVHLKRRRARVALWAHDDESARHGG